MGVLSGPWSSERSAVGACGVARGAARGGASGAAAHRRVLGGSWGAWALYCMFRVPHYWLATLAPGSGAAPRDP